MSAVRWPDIAVVAVAFFCATPKAVIAQSSDAPRLRATALNEVIRVDGLLNERAWATAERADGFLQVDPVEGAPPTARTIVRVLPETETDE